MQTMQAQKIGTKMFSDHVSQCIVVLNLHFSPFERFVLQRKCKAGPAEYLLIHYT